LPEEELLWTFCYEKWVLPMQQELPMEQEWELQSLCLAQELPLALELESVWEPVSVLQCFCLRKQAQNPLRQRTMSLRQ
jgi:hypothetical protein